MYQFLIEIGPNWIAFALLAVDWFIRLVFGARVIMRRGTVGFTLAWLSVILLVPILGAVLYLLVGERKLGSKRARRFTELRKPYEAWLKGISEDFPIDESQEDTTVTMLRRQAKATVGIPALPGNSLELYSDANTIFDKLVADIDEAKSSVHLEFYIWHDGGRVDDVCEALMRAQERGVACRVLVDDVGGDELLKSRWLGKFADCGISVEAMLKVGVIRAFLSRMDLRNHRKIVVIDGEIAWTGSQNMADPGIEKHKEDVGGWVDAMVRMTGPAVEALQLTFLADWEFETYEGIDKKAADFDLRRNTKSGTAMVQVVPSGPGVEESEIQELILTAIYGAERELILTTPYLIPDDALVMALRSAAARGVDVQIIVPRKPDGVVVRAAGEAYFDELMDAGIKIARYANGMLHTKAITVDGEVALFGTVNLDMRSFYLNFEISLLVYDRQFAGEVCRLQRHYQEDSEPLLIKDWRRRPLYKRFLQHCAQLLSPVL